VVAIQTIHEGTASIDFAPPDLPQGWARFSIRPGSEAGATLETHDVARQPFGTDVPAWGFDATDLWWNPGESGWGVAAIQHGSEVFAVMLTYTYSGFPTFYVIPSRRVADDPFFEDRFAGSAYYVRAPSSLAGFDPASVRAENRGSASMTLPRAAGGRIGAAMEFYALDDRFHATLVRLPFGAGK
jgi:hypothetical protein